MKCNNQGQNMLICLSEVLNLLINQITESFYKGQCYVTSTLLHFKKGKEPNYEHSLFLTIFKIKILHIFSNSLRLLSAMQKCRSIGWKWPITLDVLFCYYDDVLDKVPSDCVIPCNDGGIFDIKSKKEFLFN